MNNKELFQEILKVDTSAEVKEILTKNNLWNDLDLWRAYGDTDNNAGSAMNQQSTAERSLLEKITNSIDSVLTSECMVKGIDPSSNQAPKNMKEAVAKFFSNKEVIDIERDGSIYNWEEKLVVEVARKNIQLFATGKGSRTNPGHPSINIFDAGEGQTPSEFPNTFLSLGKNNKQNIFFVQGRFNMGGSGILRFCEDHMQLIISKRNPRILQNFPSKDPKSAEWGFTLTRFHFEKGNKNPTLLYLAPNGANNNPKKGEVLSFKSENLKLKANLNKSYNDSVSHGTLMKFYEFKSPRKSNILLQGELQDLIEKNMPESSLPIRIHECRQEFKGKAESSFVSNIVGLKNRILRNRGDVLEEVSPYSQEMKIDNNLFTLHFFAFKKNTYNWLANEGIIYSMNGQYHGGKTASFFTRKKISLSYISKSLLVIVDCSKIKEEAFFQLFMGNRETTVATDLMKDIELTLEDIIANHDGFRRLAQLRQKEDQVEQLKDDKSLEQIMEGLIKDNKVLANIFGIGERLSSAYNRNVKLVPKSDFKLEQHPTFFKFYKTDKKVFNTNAPINKKKLYKFSTNVVNDYFERLRYKGKFQVFIKKGERLKPYESKVGISLSEGLIKYNLDIPKGTFVGEKLEFEFHLTDTTLIKPFILKSNLKVTAAIKPMTREGGSRKRNKSDPLKISDQPGNDREIRKGLDLPHLQWQGKNKYNVRNWDDDSVLDIQQGSEKDQFLWFINENNICLENEIKQFGKDEIKLMAIKEKFRISMALLGISIKHIIKKKKLFEDDFEKEQKAIRDSSKYLAPVMMTIVEKVSDIEIALNYAAEETEE